MFIRYGTRLFRAYTLRLLSALMRFSMALNVTPAELDSVRSVERNCSKHISVVNDIFSWEKEVLASKLGHQEGAALCSSVQVMAKEADININAAKRVLWAMCREWEMCHDELVAKRKSAVGLGCSHDVSEYMQGLEYQMSGNELWSKSTKRYIEVSE